MVSDTMGYTMSYVPGFSVKNLILYILFILIVLRLKNVKLPSNIIPVNIYFIILILIAIISWMVSSAIVAGVNYDSYRSFLVLKILIDQYLFFFVFLFALTDKDDILWCIKAITCIVIIGNIITIIDVFNIPDLGIIHERPDGRVSGPLGEANQYAAFMVFFIPTLIGMTIVSKGITKLFYLSGILISVLVWILTVSRGSMVGIAFGIFIGIIILKDYVNIKSIVKILLFIVPFLILIAPFTLYRYFDLIYSRIVVGTGQAEDLVSMSAGRTLIWSRALEKLYDSPGNIFIGMGWNTFKQYFPYAAHNIYLNYIFELGIIGLVLILIVFYKLFNITYNSLSYAGEFEKIILVSFLFGYLALLFSVFFVDLYQPWVFIWSFIGLMTRLALEISSEHN